MGVGFARFPAPLWGWESLVMVVNQEMRLGRGARRRSGPAGAPGERCRRAGTPRAPRSVPEGPRRTVPGAPGELGEPGGPGGVPAGAGR